MTIMDGPPFPYWSFDIGHSLLIRHSSFDIRHFSGGATELFTSMELLHPFRV
jgi:hypothetical protein